MYKFLSKLHPGGILIVASKNIIPPTSLPSSVGGNKTRFFPQSLWNESMEAEPPNPRLETHNLKNPSCAVETIPLIASFDRLAIRSLDLFLKDEPDRSELKYQRWIDR